MSLHVVVVFRLQASLSCKRAVRAVRVHYVFNLNLCTDTLSHSVTYCHLHCLLRIFFEYLLNLRRIHTTAAYKYRSLNQKDHDEFSF